MAEADSATGLDGGHRVTLKFTIDVDADAVPDGETIRVWMPFPIESMRQKNVQLLSSSDDVTYSQSPVHNTIYMERKAEKGKAAHFEAVLLMMSIRSVSRKIICSNMQRPTTNRRKCIRNTRQTKACKYC